MLQVNLTTKRVTIWSLILNIQVSCLCLPPSNSHWCHGVTQRKTRCLLYSAAHHNGTAQDASCYTTLQPPPFSEKQESISSIHIIQHDPGGKSAEPAYFRMDGTMEINGHMVLFAEAALSSSAPAGPWGHSFYTPLTYMTNILHLRNRRSTLTRYNPGLAVPQVQSVAPPSTFGVIFQKCAQVKMDADPPQVTFFLQIYNNGPVDGTNLSQVAIRDSISGIVPLKSEGRVVERGYQTFAIDSLSAGSQVVVNYTAYIKSHKSEVLHLPAFLTFSNASQNDVSMFGPLTASLTLVVNSTDRIYPNHGVHFAGFVAGFFVTLVMLSLGFLAMNLIGLQTRLNLLQQRRNRRDSAPEYADCNMSETVKDEAAFEDKMVDTMVLEDPQNMYQALENLEMSTLLHATNNLEATRIQIYKDVMSSLLGGLRSRGQCSAQAQQRLLSVLHGQMLGMEGRLKEERGARMATLAGQCNLETREEMEAEHRREAAEKAQAELLCQHADQQELLHCSVLLEKLHKLSQSQLQRILLVRHEEASGKVQRQIIEWRRVELHKIFSEELEEATRMGELEKSTAKSLQHNYFACQDQLEEVLDVVLANQRYVLAERHAQRKFLVHSLHSLNSLISDSFSSTSNNLDSWFTHIRRGSIVPAEQIDQLQDKAQKELVMVRQRLDEALSQERRAMRCGLIKKRRELISDMLRAHKQRQKDLSALSKGLEERIDVVQHLHCWQNLLTAQSLELAELINNLDEAAAADIRKVTMRMIQGAITEVKAIQPSATQALLTLLPPGQQRSLLQVEPEGGPGQAQGQGASALLQGQEKLHQEGKAALCTLSCTREALRDAIERELQEQRELRAQCRAFFSCLCSSQLTLSEDDQLRMKLEFQKCLSVMDRCLVLPHAISRTKLHTALANWRKEREQQMTNNKSKGITSEARQKTGRSELLLFQKKLEDSIQLFEMEKETESSIMNKVHVEGQAVRYSTCECPIGRDKCHHMAALLIWVEKNVSRTDVECVWKKANAPKGDDIATKRVSEMTPSTTRAGIKRPVTQEDKEWAQASLLQLGRFTGMGWILSPETPQTLPIKMFDGLVTSPGFVQAEDKALYVLSMLAVNDQEKQQIEEATVGQAKNSLWFTYRKKRITASNFGLVLAAVKRKSYPPSLFKTLLGQYNLKEGSKACDWGILHEPRAKQEYTERTGVVIQERGLFLSDSGLLGGSPDGTVFGNCVIEVKCPWSARTKTILQAAESRDFFMEFDEVVGSLTLKQSHNYWHQIQGNLHLTGANSCHLLVWTPLDLVILPVLKDPTWAVNIDTLEIFYKDCFLPYILSQF